jgi:phosphoribosylformimino-5-aminoimidazole carboxamide ribonucleotide (ProFAR) isomerase
MLVIPALDLYAGQVVRLREGKLLANFRRLVELCS